MLYIGLKCGIQGCGKRIDGYVDELKEHHVKDHRMPSSSKLPSQIQCSICGQQYWFFSALKTHIKQNHPRRDLQPAQQNENIIEDPPVDELNANEADIEIAVTGLTNPHFYDCENVSLEQTSSIISELITNLRCDVSLPESKLQAFIGGFSKILNNSQKHTMFLVKKFLVEKNIPLSDETVDFINSLYIPDLSTAVSEATSNVTYLAVKSDCCIPEPETIILGKRTKTQNVLVNASGKRKFYQMFKDDLRAKKTVTETDSIHYLSIIDTLKLIFSNSEARNMVAEEQRRSDGINQSYKDANQFLVHQFLQRFPNAIRLSIHLDEGEYCNPLGSRKSKNKLTNVYFKVQNFNSKINSSLDRIYLLMMINSKYVKSYGYTKLLEPLITDLKKLESADGVRMSLGQNIFTLRAVLVSILGDTAAVHDIFGLLSASANKFCRICEISRPQMHSGMLGEQELRSVETVERELGQVQSKVITAKSCGIKEKCALHALEYFRWPVNFGMDPMHDLLEGVVPLVIKLILKSAISATFSDADINKRISEFNYGPTEVADKPTSNFSTSHLNGKAKLVQSASQNWLLLRIFPFLFADILNAETSELIGSLLQICFLSFTNKMTNTLVSDFKKVLLDFHEAFKICFPSLKAINKVHHIAHYARICEESGPVCNNSCLLFEAKFKDSKAQAKTMRNFKNPTYSLTKRESLKQANSIINHSYEIDVPVILKESKIRKDLIDTALILLDQPEMVTVVENLTINSTRFRPGYVLKYQKPNGNYYGILLYVIRNTEGLLFVIQELNVVDFDRLLFAYKVTKSINVIRVSGDKILTRKTYTLWTLDNTDSEYYYISLKYNDD